MDRPPDAAAPCRAVQLRGGTGTPLWFVPPVHGNPLCYLEVARRAPPGPAFYSVQTPGLEDDREPFDQLVPFAGALVEQIRAVQPHGPYVLAGWSFGGALALEIALQLRALGEPVPALVLIASTPPSIDHLTAARQIMDGYPLWKICFMYASQMAHSIGQRLDLDAEYAAFRGLADDAACTLLAARLALVGTVPADAPQAEIRRWARVFRASLIAFHHYDACAKFAGRTLALSPAHPNPVHHSPMVDRPLPKGDWHNHVEQLETIAVEGDPLNLMARPWVDGVIDAIDRWLRHLSGNAISK